MIKIRAGIPLSITGFVVAAGLTYHLVPNHPHLRMTQRMQTAVAHHNLLGMVHQLTRSNQELMTEASSIAGTLGTAHHRLQGLFSVKHSLTQEIEANALVVGTLNHELVLNQSIVSSQETIVTRESQTLSDNRLVATNLNQLGANIIGVSGSMQTLYGETGQLNTHLVSLSETLQGIVSALHSLQQNTSLPIVQIPVTSILPPVFGGGSSSPTTTLSKTPSSITHVVNNTAQSLLGGL